MSSKRGTYVKDPYAAVLVDNISNGMLSLERADGKCTLLKPGETAQITWTEFVAYKNRPGFGRFIKLNDTISIIDGQVKISNTVNELTENEMITAFVQDEQSIKEFALSLNSAEKVIFSQFLQSRKDIGIESDKSDSIMRFMESLNKIKKNNNKGTTKISKANLSKKINIADDSDELDK